MQPVRKNRLNLLPDLITQQILFCEADLKATRKIYSFIIDHEPSYKGKNPSEIKKYFDYNNLSDIHHLRYISNLYFSDALLTLSSLFERRGLAREQSITSYLLGADQRNKRFMDIVRRFDSSGLRDIRDQFIAHKDPRMVSDVHGKIFSTFKIVHLENAEHLLAESRAFCSELFPIQFNNHIWEALEPAVDNMLRSIQEAPRFKEVQPLPV